MKYLLTAKLVCMTCIIMSLSSCIKNAEQSPIGCEPHPELVLPVNILSAATQEDLFFAASPRYQTSDLFFFRRSDVARKDTLRARVIGNTTGTIRVFLIPVRNGAGRNTLIMKIKDQPVDTIIYSVQNNDGDCPYLSLNTVFFNVKSLQPTEGRYNLTK
ncbi:hypothetical protein ABDD95_20915 [Mucilaginibacter sp. PAMB04274]|uniref:hypothetical protein n=1 Tax=Mucilaginibacter sp. PAMB04274 TaxID=3138568 RepID=UPI0031F68A68